MPGMCRITCGHCRDTFVVRKPLVESLSLSKKTLLLPPQFNTLTNALARCPHCRKVSSVGEDYARIRCRIYLLLGLCFLFVAIGVTYFTTSYAQTHGALYAAYVGLFFVAFVLLARMIYYATLKISEIEGKWSKSLNFGLGGLEVFLKVRP